MWKKLTICLYFFNIKHGFFLVDQELKLRRVLEKKKSQCQGDPADPKGWPGDPARLNQKLGCNPLIFIFIKTMMFWFFKKIRINSVKTRNSDIKPG
jgi:hypothetical protein